MVRRLIIFAVHLIIVFLFMGCSDNPASNETTNYSYKVYVDCAKESAGESFLLVFDMETNLLIDSIPRLISDGLSSPIFTQNGEDAYLSVSNDQQCAIFKSQWPNMDTLAILPNICGSIKLSANENCLLCGRHLVTLPAMHHVTSIDGRLIMGGGEFIRNRSIFTLFEYGNNTLFTYDYSSNLMNYQEIPIFDSAGLELEIDGLCSSISGDTLYISAHTNVDTLLPQFVAVSTDSFKVIKNFPLEEHMVGWMKPSNYPVLHPNGNMIYWARWLKSPDADDIAYTYNLSTGISEILLTDSDLGHTLTGSHITLSPNGKFLYIDGGSTDLGSGIKHLYKMNLSDKSIEEILQLDEYSRIGKISFQRVQLDK